MTRLYQAAVAIAPFVLVLLLLRSCSRGAGDGWRAELAGFEDDLKLVLDRSDLIVVAPDEQLGLDVGEEVLAFRGLLIEDYGSLLGRGSDRRVVVGVFNDLDRLQAFASERFRRDARSVGAFHDPQRGALFLARGAPIGVLRHEVVHLVVSESRGIPGQFSPWLSEGLAQVFERYDPRGDPPQEPGPPLEPSALAVVPAGPMDVARLVHLDDYAEFVDRQGERNYAEAALLVGFCMQRRPLEVFETYLASERSRTGNHAEAFRSLYQYEEAPFRRDFSTYVDAWRGAVRAVLKGS